MRMLCVKSERHKRERERESERARKMKRLREEVMGEKIKA